jgi:hypothetical protein
MTNSPKEKKKEEKMCYLDPKGGGENWRRKRFAGEGSGKKSALDEKDRRMVLSVKGELGGSIVKLMVKSRNRETEESVKRRTFGEGLFEEERKRERKHVESMKKERMIENENKNKLGRLGLKKKGLNLAPLNERKIVSDYIQFSKLINHLHGELKDERIKNAPLKKLQKRVKFDTSNGFNIQRTPTASFHTQFHKTTHHFLNTK